MKTELKPLQLKQDPTTPSKKTLLFISYMLAQQGIALVYSLGGGLTYTGTIALVISCILGYIVINHCRSYNGTSTPLNKTVYKTVIIRVLEIFGTLFIWNILYKNLILTGTIEQQSTNQQTINNFLNSPLSTAFIIFFTCVMAPFIEEFCFRYLFMFNNRTKTRVIISTIMFTLAHLIQQPLSTPIDVWFLYFGQYFIIGFWLGYNYYKNQNYSQNVLIHASWNVLSMSMILLLG